MTEINKKFIAVTKENREFLQKAFGISRQKIWQSLNYITDYDLDKKIQKLAIERGGVVMRVTPEVETMHDADGFIRQYFPNGAMLSICKADGSISVIHKGMEVQRFMDVELDCLKEIQEFAKSL